MYRPRPGLISNEPPCIAAWRSPTSTTTAESTRWFRSSTVPAKLFRNITGGEAHWLAIRLRGRRANRQGLGAVIHVRLADGRDLYNQATTAVGYASSSEALVRFGLGSSQAVESIEVRWPGGQVQQVGI